MKKYYQMLLIRSLMVLVLSLLWIPSAFSHSLRTESILKISVDLSVDNLSQAIQWYQGGADKRYVCYYLSAASGNIDFARSLLNTSYFPSRYPHGEQTFELQNSFIRVTAQSPIQSMFLNLDFSLNNGISFLCNTNSPHFEKTSFGTLLLSAVNAAAILQLELDQYFLLQNASNAHWSAKVFPVILRELIEINLRLGRQWSRNVSALDRRFIGSEQKAQQYFYKIKGNHDAYLAILRNAELAQDDLLDTSLSQATAAAEALLLSLNNALNRRVQSKGLSELFAI